MKRISPMIAILAAVLAPGLAGCQKHRDNADQAGKPVTQSGATGAVDTPGERPVKNRGCEALPTREQLVQWLHEVPGQGEVGGFAGGRFEWAAVVDRNGVLCAIAVSSDDPASSWPGSQAIAKAKAYTANAFSSDTTPMSTARLYTMSLPGHSLWSAANGNPLNPACLDAADHAGSVGKVCGGTIAFGGGLPLYKGNTRVGGLGLSGDTPCADHEIAKRMRNAAGLNPANGPGADDILYSGVDGPSVFTHPLCVNTWRNGKKIGDEAVSAGY